MNHSLIERTRAGGTDGRLFKAEEADVIPGAVLRMVDSSGDSSPFSDFVVLRVRETPPDPARPAVVEVTLARPYLYASGTGTACPSALTGVETLKVAMGSILRDGSSFRVVATSLGKPHDFSR
jgi:hypothetical protein